MKTIINGREKEILFEGKNTTVDGIDFDGHRILWGFNYVPKTYLKESELSGDEWRKGGTVNFFRNGVQVYEQFCREPDKAIFIIAEFLYKLMDFDWDGLREGRKVYWRNMPAKIGHIMLDQGAMMVEIDGDGVFPDAVWADEDWQRLEDPKKVKIDIFDKDLWWYR